MSVIVRYQVRIFGGGYVLKNGKPLKFDTESEVDKWIEDNKHNYKERLCLVQIIR